MNDTTPFDCPDCDLTVKHHHAKPMTLLDAEVAFDIQTFVVTSSGDPSPEVTELLAQEGWSIVRTEWLRESGDLPQAEGEERIVRESLEDALENDRCGICFSVDHFREDCPRPVAVPEQCPVCNAYGFHVERCPLPAAEERGRAEVAAKFEALADPQQWTRWLTPGAAGWVADRLRALVGEVAG